MSRKIVGLIVACLLAGTLAADTYMLSGQDKTLWVLRRTDDSFDLLTRNADGKWKWLSRGNTGAPSAVASTGGALHVFFAGGNQLVYTSDLPNGTFGPSVEGNVLSACAANDGIVVLAWTPIVTTRTATSRGEASGEAGSGAFNAPATQATSASAGGPVLDMTSQPASTPQSSAYTTIASAPASGASTVLAKLVRLNAFKNSEGRWQLIGTLQNFALAMDVKVFAAFHQGRLHVMITSVSDGQSRLLVLDETQWREVQFPLKGPLASGQAGGDVVGLFSVAGRLVILTQQDMDDRTRQMHLGWATAPDGEWTWQKLSSQDKKPISWPAGTTFSPAILQQRVAVLSLSSGQEVPQLALFELDGVEVRSEPLDVLKHYASDEFAQEVLQYFLWGVLIAIFIPLFLVRPATPPKPFTLPEGVRPGALARRLVAAILDFVPFVVISAIAFPTPPLSPEEIRSLVQEQQLPENFVFSVVSTLSLYVIYCIVMEHRFAATLGKMAFRLRVVGDGGKPPTTREVVLRNLTKIVELIWPIGLPFLILLPLLSRNRQRLGDMLARTTVVDVASLPARPPIEPKEPTHEEQEQ